MRYGNLGNTDLRVSRICMGCMGFGDPAAGQHQWTLPEAPSREILRHALERGIKAFATSFEEAQALLAGMQESQKTLAQALEKLNAAATSAQHDLPQALQSTRDAMNNVSSVSLATKAIVERNAPLTQELRRLIQESAAAVRSLRAFMDVLERNPEALLRGKQGSRR